MRLDHCPNGAGKVSNLYLYSLLVFPTSFKFAKMDFLLPLNSEGSRFVLSKVSMAILMSFRVVLLVAELAVTASSAQPPTSAPGSNEPPACCMRRLERNNDAEKGKYWDLP